MGGAFLFQYIEGASEIEARKNIVETRRHRIQTLWNLTCTLNLFEEEKWRTGVRRLLEDHQDFLVEAIRSGYDGSDSAEVTKQWSFSGAFLYSLTVITTIGKNRNTYQQPFNKMDQSVFFSWYTLILLNIYLTS